MNQGFFINPTIIREILSWRAKSGENLAVFEPIAKTLDAVSQHFADGAEKDVSRRIHNVLDAWCSSADFAELLLEASKRRVSIGIELARQSLSIYSGSESFVHGVPVGDILTFFSSFLRAELRNRESRASVRLDELFIYNSYLRRLNMHDIALYLIVHALSGSEALLNKLIQIKEDPTNLHQLDPSHFPFENGSEFASALRMFALSNFTGALTGFKISCSKPLQEISSGAAIVLSHYLLGEKEQAEAERAELSSRCGDPIFDSLALVTNQDPAGLEPGEADFPGKYLLYAFLFLQNREYKQGCRLLELHLDKNPQDILACLMQVEAKLLPLRDSLAQDPPLPLEFDKTEQEILEAAREQLANIRSQAYSAGLLAFQSIAETNLSHVLLILRDFSTSCRCALAARASGAGNAGARINQASASLAMGDLPSVLKILGNLGESHELHGKLLLAEAYYHASSLEEATAVWKGLLDTEHNRLWRMRILCRLLESYRLLRDQKNAQNTVDQLLSQYQEEPEVLFAIAYELWQMGMSEDAIKTLRRARDVSSPNLCKWISWELGRFLFEQGQNLSATDEYLSISERSKDSIQGREFAVALYKAGLLPAAYEWAQALRLAHTDVIPGITEIETDYLVRTQRIAEAKELLQRLCQLRPLSVLNRMALVRICLSLGQEAEARAELDKIAALSLTEEMRVELDRFLTDLNLVDSLKTKEGA